jgi:hypothetical protein
MNGDCLARTIDWSRLSVALLPLAVNNSVGTAAVGNMTGVVP